jgi:hypothetical protein
MREYARNRLIFIYISQLTNVTDVFLSVSMSVLCAKFSVLSSFSVPNSSFATVQASSHVFLPLNPIAPGTLQYIH